MSITGSRWGKLSYVRRLDNSTGIAPNLISWLHCASASYLFAETLMFSSVVYIRTRFMELESSVLRNTERYRYTILPLAPHLLKRAPVHTTVPQHPQIYPRGIRTSQWCTQKKADCLPKTLTILLWLWALRQNVSKSLPHKTCRCSSWDSYKPRAKQFPVTMLWSSYGRSLRPSVHPSVCRSVGAVCTDSWANQCVWQPGTRVFAGSIQFLRTVVLSRGSQSRGV